MSDPGARYDRSFADLMAGVAVVFLLLAAIFIRLVNEQSRKWQAEHEAAIDSGSKVSAEAEAVRNSLVTLHRALAGVNDSLGGQFLELSSLDGGVNALEITFKDLQFAPGRCQAPRHNAEQLHKGAVTLLSTVCGTVSEIRDAGAEATIILEGHTDPQAFSTPSHDCGVVSVDPGFRFKNNVRLSAARAQEVFFALRDELEAADAGTQLRCLDDNFVVSGRGEAAPLDRSHPEDPHNRRLVIRVRGDLRLQ